jgi:hypothetical protein
MIEVVVRIDDEAQRLVGEALERGADLVGERRELVVDDHDAVLADRCSDVAARTFQHVHAARDLRDLDLDLAEILLLGACGARDSGQRTEQHGANPIVHDVLHQGLPSLLNVIDGSGF